MQHNLLFYLHKTLHTSYIIVLSLFFHKIFTIYIKNVTQHVLVIYIKNSATCFGSLSHHQAKYKTQYWYIVVFID